jgi:hypothetical protein
MNRLVMIAVCGLLLSPMSLFAQVTRVEVDWEVRVREADYESFSPQISIIMANRRDLTGEFAEFRLNPDYEGIQGGMQIDTWLGTERLAESSHLPRPALATISERITFTTVATAGESQTKYSLEGVHCNSWGDVSDSEIAPCHTVGEGLIRFSMNLTLNESEVEYGHNRVDYVIAKEVRYYIGNALAKRDRTGYYIFKEGESYKGPVSPEEVIDSYIAF